MPYYCVGSDNKIIIIKNYLKEGEVAPEGYRWVEFPLLGEDGEPEHPVIPQSVDMEDMLWNEGQKVITYEDPPKYDGVPVRNASEVDVITGNEIRRILTIDDQLKEMRRALKSADNPIPQDDEIESVVDAGKAFKEEQGW